MHKLVLKVLFRVCRMITTAQRVDSCLQTLLIEAYRDEWPKLYTDPAGRRHASDRHGDAGLRMHFSLIKSIQTDVSYQKSQEGITKQLVRRHAVYGICMYIPTQATAVGHATTGLSRRSRYIHMYIHTYVTRICKKSKLGRMFTVRLQLPARGLE